MSLKAHCYCHLLIHAGSFLFWPFERANGQNIWHTAQPLTSNAFVDAQGSPPNGQFHSLDLRCDKSLGSCSWLITTQVLFTTGTGHTYDLWIRDPAGFATNLVVSQSSITGSPFSNAIEVSENISGTEHWTPGGFLSRIRASSFPAQIPSSGIPRFMHSFVLTDNSISMSGSVNLMAGSVYGFQGTGFGTDPGYGTRPTVVDANPPLRHVFLEEEWPNPVINIQSIPEPTSAALLLAPAVLLMRRRRQTGRR